MVAIQDPFNALTAFDSDAEPGDHRRYFALASLERAGLGRSSRLPVCLRVVLESLLRNCDGERVTTSQVEALAGWQPNAPRIAEIPFVVARILLQDISGLPALNDLAAMRAAALRLGADPSEIEPGIPVDLVVDHAVSVDFHGRPDAATRNLELEYRRGSERLRLLKWGQQAFSRLRVIPPGNGIVHQINLEHLASGVCERDGLIFPDTLVATDSHAPMVNGIGVLGWGVGGIEAMAGMLGEPICFLTPDVVGVHLKGRLHSAATATDLVLTLTERLRYMNVVGKFVEYFGAGAASLAAADRATVANMAADYGATCGYFAVDERTLDYFRHTGRRAQQVSDIERYYRLQGLFGIPRAGDCDYTVIVEFDLSEVEPVVSGPSKPEQRLALTSIGQRFDQLLHAPRAEGGFGRTSDPPRAQAEGLRHGDVLIAAITSCTNTSNPRLMLAAGVLAKNAIERGMQVPPHVKTSLAPGSKAVSAYLSKAGLLPYLKRLGFHVVGYGCTTCMGNSGPLLADAEVALARHDLIACAVLSGNRNFEARIHPSLKANFLMSPALVVAFALAGTIRIDPEQDPLARDGAGRPVFLRELWPAPGEIEALLPHAHSPELYRREYADLQPAPALWDAIEAPQGPLYDWNPQSTFIVQPPFLENVTLAPPGIGNIIGARALAIFGDGLTTDHISPNAGIRPQSAAGAWLREHGAAEMDSYAMRRCNHHVMARGTFDNPRLVNLLADGEGGITRMSPDTAAIDIFEASRRWRDAGVPLLVFGGEEYGTGSSRDWAARGPCLLGVRAVIARSFERIHRSNLVGMGVLPLQLPSGISAQTLQLDGSETFDLDGLAGDLTPGQLVPLIIRRPNGSSSEVSLRLCAQTVVEGAYLIHGGIMPYVLRKQLERRCHRHANDPSARNGLAACDPRPE